MSNVFKVSEEDIEEDTTQENLDSWDSFNFLMLVSELEKNFSIRLTTGDVSSINSYSDIKKILALKGVDILRFTSIS